MNLYIFNTGDNSVEEYQRKFEELHRFDPKLVEGDLEKMHKFHEGLKEELLCYYI